jgi:hypothetical protein
MDGSLGCASPSFVITQFSVGTSSTNGFFQAAPPVVASRIAVSSV